ncbi:MAG: site-specific DNA-methyltransferase [Ruminococcus sp.]|nr:site-specific DNA-methyltransferase [Ruminococcus sp.]
MSNLSQKKRQRMFELLARIREEHRDDDETLSAINEIENELNAKKYGLVWEEHEEAVNVQMRTHIPVFTEDTDKEITTLPEQDYNFLLEGDNLHSLYLLEKTHRGRIDVIYIDPPYNTKNKDFVYDDCKIGEDDGFRHSKWISFMNIRLKKAKQLISKNGVIVISIGYQEVHNLMLLCQEIFDNRQIMCVTVQTSGGKPNGCFNITHEYLIFIAPNDFEATESRDSQNSYSSPYHGMNLATFNQVQRPNQAYPIFIDSNGCIVGCGKSLQEKINSGEFKGNPADYVFDYNEAPEGTVAVYPVTTKGEACVWRLISSRLLSDWKKGYIKVVPQNNNKNKNKYAVQYLSEGVIKKIENGEFESYRISEDERIPTIDVKSYKTAGAGISTIWTDKQNYTTKGSNQIKEIFGGKPFSYPKPLELIITIMQKVTKKNSIILDFFAGSGTTAQAVLELNQQDGGKRKFILCTNNENNICTDVTYPRINTVISGKRQDGSIYSDGIPANLKYYRTDFVARDCEYLSDELLEHVAEMIQLENGVKIDGSQYIMLLDEQDADELAENWENFSKVKTIYVAKDVLFTTEQAKIFANVDIKTIPDYYFEFDLRQEGESW